MTAISSAQEIFALPRKPNATEAAEFATRHAAFERAMEGLDPQAIASRLAQQQNVEAHTVYRAGGKVIAVQYQDGTTGYPVGGDIGGATAAKKEAHSLSLSRAAQNDYIAGRLEANLRERFGQGLSVERFTSGSAPTQGQLMAEYNAVASPPSRVAIDAQSLEKLFSE